MPYALPALNGEEHGTLVRWLKDGAPRTAPPALSPELVENVPRWESFLNRRPEGAAHEPLHLRALVPGAPVLRRPARRASTSTWCARARRPAQPIDIIATRRPYDDPGVPRVYYRLRRVDETLVAKTHMPYALERRADDAAARAVPRRRATRSRSLPSYDDRDRRPIRSLTFRRLPSARAIGFMLDEAQFTIMGFIKGPVCRGQVALNVIDDRFWVAFVDPELEQSELKEDELAEALRRDLQLPAEDGSNRCRCSSGSSYAAIARRAISRPRATTLNRNLGGKQAPTLAADLGRRRQQHERRADDLPPLRQRDGRAGLRRRRSRRPPGSSATRCSSASTICWSPATTSIGNVGHQLTTRLYMDFLRMEGESNFLALLPRARRRARPLVPRRRRRREGLPRRSGEHFSGDSGIAFATGDPLAELYGLLKARLAKVDSGRYALESGGLAGAPLASLRELGRVRGRAVSHLPETAFLTVRDAGGRAHHYTLIGNDAHANVAVLLGEERRRLPDEDTLTVVSGLAVAGLGRVVDVDAAEVELAHVAHRLEDLLRVGLGRRA